MVVTDRPISRSGTWFWGEQLMDCCPEVFRQYGLGDKAAGAAENRLACDGHAMFIYHDHRDCVRHETANCRMIAGAGVAVEVIIDQYQMWQQIFGTASRHLWLDCPEKSMLAGILSEMVPICSRGPSDSIPAVHVKCLQDLSLARRASPMRNRPDTIPACGIPTIPFQFLEVSPARAVGML